MGGMGGRGVGFRGVSKVDGTFASIYPRVYILF